MPNMLAILGSPFEQRVLAASISASASFVDGPGTVAATKGLETYVLIHPRDQFGNKLRDPGLEADFAVRISPAAGFPASTVRVFGPLMEDSGALYSFTYSATAATTLDLRVTYARPGASQFGAHLTGSPRRVVVGETADAVSPTQSYALGDGLTGAVCGVRTHIVVKLVDEDGALTVAPEEALADPQAYLTFDITAASPASGGAAAPFADTIRVR
eukprot:8590686-Pyramimonas_sp.AAC.1